MKIEIRDYTNDVKNGELTGTLEYANGQWQATGSGKGVLADLTDLKHPLLGDDGQPIGLDPSRMAEQLPKLCRDNPRIRAIVTGTAKASPKTKVMLFNPRTTSPEQIAAAINASIDAAAKAKQSRNPEPPDKGE